MKFSLFLALMISILNNSTRAQSLNESFETSGNLTDQQAKEAKDFVHQGKKDGIISEQCSTQGLGTCSQNEVNSQASVFKGNFGEAIEQNIGKFYGLLFGASGFMTGGGGPTVGVVSKANKTDTGTYVKDGKEVKKSEAADQKSDYCIYAAMGYEFISTYIQQGLQSKIEESLKEEKDLQLKALLALKKTHEARRKTSIYQGSIYAATSACYIARAASSQGRVVMDWKYWAKMSAAAGLSTLYYVKAKKHKEAADKVQIVIDALPSVGDCNPWTKTACFCAEKTSKNLYADTYEEVCVMNQGQLDPNKVAVGCGVMKDGKMEYDKDCKCKSSNTCFKPKFTSPNMKLGLGNNMMNMANTGFDLLGNGDFDSGAFDSYAIKSGAYAAKTKKLIEPKNTPKINLSKKEKEIADSLKGALPESVAALVAQSPSINPPGGLGDKSVSTALDKLPKDLKEKVAGTEKSSDSKRGGGFSAVEDDEELGFSMPGKEEESQAGTEILTFADKALEKADVTQTPDTPLFDIISNRYLRSGINKLQVEEEKK
jgi:hypothetical protein